MGISRSKYWRMKKIKKNKNGELDHCVGMESFLRCNSSVGFSMRQTVIAYLFVFSGHESSRQTSCFNLKINQGIHDIDENLVFVFITSYQSAQISIPVLGKRICVPSSN